MKTEEKLFVQIFERKNWIIEQVKQQTDFYIQNLASKLLIDGITPPPWLWNPSSHSHSSEPKELNKEELISKLLLQNPRNPYVSGHCTVYDKPAVTRDNTELSGRYYRDAHASSKKIDESISVLDSRDNDVGCALNDGHEVDFIVNSPRDETDARISNIYSAPDQSLARIQRSKSRQKALELRTSEKAAAKSCLNHENRAGICFGGDSLSRIDFQQANQDKGSSISVSGKNTECREASERNCGEGFGTSNYIDEITKSRSPYKQAVSVTESHKDGYSEGAKEVGDVLLQSAHYDSELKEMANTSDATSGSDNFCGRVTKSRISSLKAHLINRSSQDGISTHTAKAGSATFAQSMHKPVEQVVHSNKLQKAVISSDEIIGRKTRSQTTSNTEKRSLPVKSSGIASRRITRSRSAAIKESPIAKSLNKNEANALPNVLGCQPIPLCPIADVNQHGNDEMETQLVNVHSEAQPLYLGSNLDGSHLKEDSEGLVLSSSSNCHMGVLPKQLDFGDTEECNLNKNSSPPPRKEGVNQSSGEKSSALLDTLAWPDEVTPDSPNEGFVEELSPMLGNVPTKLEEAQNDVNVEECSKDEIDKFGSKVNKNPVVPTGECNSEAALHNQVSSLEDPSSSDVLHNSDKAHLENRKVIEGYLPSSMLQIEEGELGSKEKNSTAATPSKSIPKLAESSVISSLAKQRINDFQNCLDKEVGTPEPTGFDAAKQLHEQDMQNIFHGEITDFFPEKMLVKSNTDVRDGGMSRHGLIDLQCADKNCASFSGQTEAQFAKSSLLPKMKVNPTKVESWPQSKRRKVEDQLFNGFSASPSFRIQMPRNIQRGSTRYLENTGNISDSGQELQALSLSTEGKLSVPNANKSSDVGSYHEIQYPMASDIDFSPSFQVKEGEFGSEVDNKTVGTPFTFNDRQSRPSYLQSLTKKAPVGSTYSLGESVETSTLGDVSNLYPEYRVNVVNADNNLTAERNFPKRISHVRGDGLLSHYSAWSPHNDRDSVGYDETMPVFEGFIIDGQTENTGDILNMNPLDLPSTTSEHTRILEEICKSASMQTPLSHFSSKFKVHGLHDLYQSVPNGLLERADWKGTLPLDIDVHKLHASYSCLDEVKSSLHGVPYSNSLSYSGTPFGWNSRNHYASPVGKLWDRFSSSSSSSKKRLSSNPELFPIEEDPSVSEENENAEEADEIQQETVSRVINESAKRQPLVEITEAEKHHNRDSVESVTTGSSFHGTHNRVKQKRRNHWSKNRSTKEGKESQTSFGAQSTKKGIKSLQSGFSKPKSSGKTSPKKGAERISQKEPKINNIVTGITSFIPQVQQKQAAAVCPAKRDIKVKALEAAEAAKRLAEKRENERKMKIEAMKIERARIGKENSREMELNKKKKEEEQKKKENIREMELNKKKKEEQKKREADMAARKRLREEEERKEKNKRRKRVAEGRLEQKLADEKLRAGKVEKNKNGKMDEKVNRGKEPETPLEKKKNNVNEGGDENYFKKPNTDPQTSYVSEDPHASSYCDNEREQMCMLEKTAVRNDSATVRSQEISYDISPYQCSDDEEEEDEIPTTKCIPSWASVDFVPSLQNKLDPDVIFPRESFCNMNEVLLPRRLQVK